MPNSSSPVLWAAPASKPTAGIGRSVIVTAAAECEAAVVQPGRRQVRMIGNLQKSLAGRHQDWAEIDSMVARTDRAMTKICILLFNSPQRGFSANHPARSSRQSPASVSSGVRKRRSDPIKAVRAVRLMLIEPMPPLPRSERSADVARVSTWRSSPRCLVRRSSATPVEGKHFRARR